MNVVTRGLWALPHTNDAGLGRHVSKNDRVRADDRPVTHHDRPRTTAPGEDLHSVPKRRLPPNPRSPTRGTGLGGAPLGPTSGEGANMLVAGLRHAPQVGQQDADHRVHTWRDGGADVERYL